MSDIQWNTVLRKISREFDGLPPEPSEAQRRARREIERRTLDLQRRRNVLLGTIGRMVLVTTLGVAINFWPYEHACGVGLIGYMAAESLIVVGGLWSVVWTWQQRMPRIHALAMAVVLWGLILLAAQVLPRVGYAKVDPSAVPHWWCAT
jgi:hypothetical protein